MKNLKFHQEILKEALFFCEEERRATSTTKGKLGCLDRILRGIDKIVPLEINSWLEAYVSQRTHQSLGPHGKNAYILTLHWYLKRTKLTDNVEQIIQGLKRYRTKSRGQIISEDEMEEILRFFPSEYH